MTPPQVTTSDSPSLSIAEDTYEPCPCVTPPAFAPSTSCFACNGSGYRLTKRILRPSVTPTLSDQAALSRIHTLEAALEKAARTLDIAADRFDKAGLQKDAGATRAAAQALREGG